MAVYLTAVAARLEPQWRPGWDCSGGQDRRASQAGTAGTTFEGMDMVMAAGDCSH